jgi:hypothetical protein
MKLRIQKYSIAFSIKGPVTIPTIIVLGRKVRSNLVSIVQFFVLIPKLE